MTKVTAEELREAWPAMHDHGAECSECRGSGPTVCVWCALRAALDLLAEGEARLCACGGPHYCESEMAEARKDTERLDWLDKQMPEDVTGGDHLKWAVGVAPSYAEHDDLRAAIDAARSGEEGGE